MKYELLTPIGTGGMATVHRARLRGVAGFERMVAIKRIRPELARDADYVARFVNEARIVSMFSHPNIVQVFELGRLDHAHFIAMEHLEGWSLLRIAAAAYAARIRIPLGVIISLLRDLCEALDHIHARGIIHRDISHGNLFVLRTGRLKVLDFGIASPPTTGRATEIIGKPSYMSPEVIRGVACDARTDVFAAGVIAWELLTNEKLFAGTSDHETMRAVLHQRVPAPSQLRDECPIMLDAIVRDALSRDLDVRTASAAVMRDQLEAVAAMHELDIHASVVARWIDESGLFAGPLVEVEAPSTLLDAPTFRAPARSSETPGPTPPVIPIRPRRLGWARGLAAAAVAMLSFGLVSRAAAPAPSAEGERIAMTASSPAVAGASPPAELVDVAPPVVETRVATAASPARPVTRGRAARAPRPAPVPKPAPVPTAVEVVHPVEVTPQPPPPPAPVVVRVAPPTGPAMIPPDRVRLLAGTVRQVHVDRNVRRSFTAVLCIDERGTVTSSKLPADLPAPLRLSLTRDLAGFRFTPYPRGKACFARFMKIDR